MGLSADITALLTDLGQEATLTHRSQAESRGAVTETTETVYIVPDRFVLSAVLSGNVHPSDQIVLFAADTRPTVHSTLTIGGTVYNILEVDVQQYVVETGEVYRCQIRA